MERILERIALALERQAAVMEMSFDALTGKPYKEREHNTGKPGECQEPKDASTPYKDTLYRAAAEGNLHDNLFWKMRTDLEIKGLLMKKERLIDALERLDMPESWYQKMFKAHDDEMNKAEEVFE